LFATVGKRPKLERGTARNRYEVAKRWMKRDEKDAKEKSEKGEKATLLTDAKTSGIVAKVKQTTVAVVRFRSTLATRKVSFKLRFCYFTLQHNRSNLTLSPKRVKQKWFFTVLNPFNA